MGVYIIESWTPFHKVEEAREVMAKLPKLPPYIKKWQTFTTADGNKGVKGYGIVFVEPGKAEEANIYISKLLYSFKDVEGYTWKARPALSVRDTVKMDALKL